MRLTVATGCSDSPFMCLQPAGYKCDFSSEVVLLWSVKLHRVASSVILVHLIDELKRTREGFLQFCAGYFPISNFRHDLGLVMSYHHVTSVNHWASPQNRE